jgi:hypothetical protein
VTSVTLMWSAIEPSWRVRNGWVKLTVPKVQIYEVIRLELEQQYPL